MNGISEADDIQGDYAEVCAKTVNISDELSFVRTKKFTRVYHGDICVAVLTCPGRHVLVQNNDGTLEARCLKQ